MRTTWNFFTAGHLMFGSDAAGQLGALLGRFRRQRWLIVADPTLRDAGLVDRVRRPVVEAGMTVELCDAGEAEPSIDAAYRAIEQARAFEPEGLIGLGGGSNMDMAKILAAVLTHGGTPEDYFGWDQVPSPVMPLACVPTTSGTGSEVSHAAVLTDTANQVKVSTLSNYLRPAVAVVDPQLTLSCPPKLTADAGIDALTHAVEGFTATGASQMDTPPGTWDPYDGSYPLGDALAEKAIELVGQHLVTAVQEPENLAAREGMALAATLGGMAFSNCGVALVHALEYPVGGTVHCSHGQGNGLLLPYVMRFNLPACTGRLARVAQLLGEDVAGLTERQAAERAVAAVEQLQRDIGIPQRLSEIGVKAEHLPTFATKAFAIKRLMKINPRPVVESDLLDILQTAL